eukprot:385-Heterococcus_DN1.PRE.1
MVVVIGTRSNAQQLLQYTIQPVSQADLRYCVTNSYPELRYGRCSSCVGVQWAQQLTANVCRAPPQTHTVMLCTVKSTSNWYHAVDASIHVQPMQMCAYRRLQSFVAQRDVPVKV